MNSECDDCWMQRDGKPATKFPEIQVTTEGDRPGTRPIRVYHGDTMEIEVTNEFVDSDMTITTMTRKVLITYSDPIQMVLTKSKEEKIDMVDGRDNVFGSEAG